MGTSDRGKKRLTCTPNYQRNLGKYQNNLQTLVRKVWGVQILKLAPGKVGQGYLESIKRKRLKRGFKVKRGIPLLDGPAKKERPGRCKKTTGIRSCRKRIAYLTCKEKTGHMNRQTELRTDQRAPGAI